MQLSQQMMRELADYAIQNKSDVVATSSPLELTKQMQVAVPGWRHLETEEVRERVQDILQDVVLRHGPYSSVNQYVVDEIQAEVNFQLSTSQVHFYTLIPIRGLSVSIHIRQKVQIDEHMYIRRTQAWEAPKFQNLLWGTPFEFPQFVLEYAQEISPSQFDSMLNNDFELTSRIRLILGLLQFKFGQGLSFPWIIEYVPQCQFIKNHGKMSARILPMGPGEYETRPLSVNDLTQVQELISERNSTVESIQKRVDVAIQRFHEAQNRTTIIDSLVDYWIALEALVGTEKPDQTRQMAARITSFLFRSLERKYTRASYIWLQKSYTLRSKIVHGDHYRSDSIEGLLMYKVTEQTRDVVKYTVQRMLKTTVPFERLLKEVDRVSSKMNFPHKREFEDQLDVWSIDDHIIAGMDDILTEYRKQVDEDLL